MLVYTLANTKNAFNGHLNPTKDTMTNQIQLENETFIQLLEKVKAAGLSELHALEKRIDRHFNAGTLSPEGFCALDVLIMEEIARFDSLTTNH